MELHSLQEDTDLHKDLGRKQRCQETKTNQLPAGPQQHRSSAQQNQDTTGATAPSVFHEHEMR